MKQYHALKNIKTEVIYIPFFKLTNIKGSKKEFTHYITNGIITIELKSHMLAQCEEITISQEEFIQATKELNIKELSDCDTGDLFINFGYIFTMELYQVSDEYIKKYELTYKTRALQHNPLYSKQYGSINCGWCA